MGGRKLEAHDKRLGRIEQKLDGTEKKVLTALDQNTELLRTIRQEQTATSAIIVRHDKDIKRIKEKLEMRD